MLNELKIVMHTLRDMRDRIPLGGGHYDRLPALIADPLDRGMIRRVRRRCGPSDKGGDHDYALVTSLNRPGTAMTSVSVLNELEAKRFELLC
jgi:hypothetical protein